VTYGEDCVPTRRFIELSVLAAHPALWAGFPGGDLATMPAKALYELWNHLRAERAELARDIGREVVKGVMPAMGMRA